MTHKYTTNIPKARDVIKKVVTEIEGDYPLQAARLMVAVDQMMIRKPTARRAPTTRRPVTQEIIDGVLTMYQSTDMAQEQIAAHFNIDGGRVSEIIRAKTLEQGRNQ